MIPMFGISDVVWQAAIAGIVTVAMAWIAHKTASKVEEVGKKVDSVAVVSEKIHILSNSAMGLQLRLNASHSKRLAALPVASPQDIEAAETAGKALAEHDKQQAVVDAKAA